MSRIKKFKELINKDIAKNPKSNKDSLQESLEFPHLT